jgi:putative transcriptional regulator
MSEKNDVFFSIMTGLNEAVEYQKGNLKGIKRRSVTISPLPDYSAETIKAIRNTLNLSQLIFAKALGVATKTIEAWESGRNKPQGPALRMLQLLETDHSVLEDHHIISV